MPSLRRLPKQKGVWHTPEWEERRRKHWSRARRSFVASPRCRSRPMRSPPTGRRRRERRDPSKPRRRAADRRPAETSGGDNSTSDTKTCSVLNNVWRSRYNFKETDWPSLIRITNVHRHADEDHTWDYMEAYGRFRAEVAVTCRRLLLIFSSSSTDFFSLSLVTNFCCHGSRVGFTCRTESTESASNTSQRLILPKPHKYSFEHYILLVSLLPHLNEGDPVGLLPQSRPPALPPPLTFDLWPVVLRKRLHLLLLSEDRSELPPDLQRRIQSDALPITNFYLSKSTNTTLWKYTT